MFPLFLYYKAESFNALQQFSIEILKAVSRILPATSWAQKYLKNFKKFLEKEILPFLHQFLLHRDFAQHIHIIKPDFSFFPSFSSVRYHQKDLLQIVVPDTQIVKIDFICTYHQRYSDVFLENMNGALVWYGKMIANDIFYIPKLNFNPMLNHLFSVLNRHCNNDTQYFIELSRLEIFEHMIAVRDFK